MRQNRKRSENGTCHFQTFYQYRLFYNFDEALAGIDEHCVAVLDVCVKLLRQAVDHRDLHNDCVGGASAVLKV